MAKISLRSYNHEIENLIDRGQTEEGISHCKYILKTYPKHLDTYRLLGKAFLESQRYSEAADILQRILSVQPDDFVSQIGMSIIREDEGNLDAAIYHMERAFEIQPANVAIQDELRRLYGRRDGVEPSKLRMTRGALVRMYARGDLYRQAIAEARAALKEDPQRLDLDIVLARMYFQTGLKAEAAEISSRLVGKLPYCYEANRILAEVLPETSRAEEAKIYQQKLIALDPYLASLSGTVIDPRQVPENAVALDRLEWSPSLESSQQPTWANSLGIQLNETDNEKVPQWMMTVSSSNTPVQTTADEEENAQPFTEEPSLFENRIDGFSQQEESPILDQDKELPDWMKSSGWGISSQPAQEQAEIISESDGLPAEPANIPDWLKEIAPASDSSFMEEEISPNTDWMNSILPPESIQSDQDDQNSVQVPVSEDNTDFSQTKVLSPVNEDLPDWFKTPLSVPDDTLIANQSNEPLPDWLTEMPQMQAESSLREDLPGSVGLGFQPGNSEEAPTTDAESEHEGDQIQVLPTHQESLSQDVPLAELQENTPDLTNVDDAMAWLESLAAKNGAEEGTLLTRPEERMDTPPEWVSQAASEPSTFDLLEPAENLPAEELMAETTLRSEPVVPSEEIFKQVDFVPVSTKDSISVPVDTQVTDFAEPGLSETNVDAIQPLDQTLPTGPDDMEAAFSWLESLAARQGAEAESLLIAADERQEMPPDWVQTQAAEAAILIQDASTVDAEPSVEQLPEWMQSTENTPEIPEAIQTEEQALPEWLNNIDSSSEQPFSRSENLPAASQELLVADEWILTQDALASEIVPEQEGIQTQTNETVTEMPADVERPATFGKTRPLPSWLVSDSGTGPNNEPAGSQPEPAEELPLPDWLKDEDQLETVSPSISETLTAQGAPDLPDWLKNLESEQEEETLPVASISSQISEPTEAPIVISNIPSEMLAQAQDALAKGKIDLSMGIYSQLIQKGQHIEETIHDLRDALYRYPVDSEIWQTLGDANFRNNHVQDALDAYTKAEELLK